MSTFLERLIAEKAELEVKLDGLTSFLSSGTMATLDVQNQVLLRLQAVHMRSYLQVLDKRVSNLKYPS